MKTVRKCAALLALTAIMLAACGFSAPQVFAFQHPWSNFLSINVLPGERFLYDDVSAGTPPGEAGLLLFVNNQASDETVGYSTTHGLPVNPAFRVLEARAAVSDGGFFQVGYAMSATASCTFPQAMKWPWPATGGYITKSIVLPANIFVRRVCIVLTDSADAIAFGRSSVTIDYVRLRTMAGANGWIEGFSGSP